MVLRRFIRAGKALVAPAIMLLGGYAILSQLEAATASAGVNDQLIGSWSLRSRVTTGSDGGVLTDPNLSATPTGILIYDRSGHVAAQLSRKDRTVSMITEECRSAAQIKGTSDTAQTVLGYDAYFGTYTVDEAQHV